MAVFKKLVAEIKMDVYEKKDNDPKAYRYEEEDKDMIAKKIKYLNRHLRNLQLLEKEDDQSECFGYLAIAYLKLDRLEEAKEALERQLELATEFKNEMMQRMAYGNLGVIYNLQHNVSKAVDCYQKSLELAIRFNNKYAQSRLFNNLANCEEKLMNFEAAIQYQLQNLAIAKEFNNRDSIVKACGSLAGYYHLTGQLEEAVDHLEQITDQLRKNLKVVDVLADDASDSDDCGYIPHEEHEGDEECDARHVACCKDGGAAGSSGGMLGKIKKKVKKKKGEKK